MTVRTRVETHTLTPCIDKPTRVTDPSKTIFDHVFTSYIDNTITAAVLNTYVTDHYATRLKIDFLADNKTEDCNNPTCADCDLQNTLLQTQTWNHVLDLQDVNECCTTFIQTMTSPKLNRTKQNKKKIITRFKTTETLD